MEMTLQALTSTLDALFGLPKKSEIDFGRFAARSADESVAIEGEAAAADASVGGGALTAADSGMLSVEEPCSLHSRVRFCAEPNDITDVSLVAGVGEATGATSEEGEEEEEVDKEDEASEIACACKPTLFADLAPPNDSVCCEPLNES